MLTRVTSGLVIVAALAVGAWAALGDRHAAAAESSSVVEGGSHGAAAPAEHGNAAHGEANPLAWKGDLALWTGAVFVILMLILWKFAWGPIADGLDKREKVVANQIAEAERVNREARDLLSGYQQKLAQAQDEVRVILDQARREAEQNTRATLDKAREEAKREQEKAVREIELATAGALKELAEKSATMAVDLAGRIVGARLRPEDHSRLIQDAVSNFAKVRPNGN
jgi:F-type H+-transporting ATPase subunit b